MASPSSPSKLVAKPEEEEAKADPNVYNSSSPFWNKYRRGRPRIPPSFYNRFYTHHATFPASNKSFSTVLDAGCGFGELSLPLASRFAHVTLLDPAPSSLAVAKEYITSVVASSSSEHGTNTQSSTKTSTLQSSQFTFINEKIEETTLPASSIDAIFCTTALHWMDPERAVKSMTRLLKPGGTLFIATCGVARWNHPQIQALWWRLLSEGIKATITKNPATKESVERSSAIADTGYDCVYLFESEWEARSVVRLKLNIMGEEDALVFAPGANGDVPVYEGRVGEGDRVLEGMEEEWFFEKDLEGIREVFESYPFEPPEEVEREVWGEMEGILGGLEGGKVGGRWVVSVVLATRKRE